MSLALQVSTSRPARSPFAISVIRGGFMLTFEFDRLFDPQMSSYAPQFHQTRPSPSSKCAIFCQSTPEFCLPQTFQSSLSTRAFSFVPTDSFSCFLL